MDWAQTLSDWETLGFRHSSGILPKMRRTEDLTPFSQYWRDFLAFSLDRIKRCENWVEKFEIWELFLLLLVSLKSGDFIGPD